MDTSTYLENRLIERLVDHQKQKYLHKKVPFVSVLIPFKGTKAWIIPIMPRDLEHKNMLIHIIAAGFAAKDIKRFGYFFDGWTGRGLAGEELEGLSPEEKERRLEEHRKTMPHDFSKGDFDGRGESISWGIITEDGPLSHTCQSHDSKTHTLLSKAMSTSAGEVRAKLHIFERLIPLARGADFKKAGMSKAEMWAMTEAYFKAEGFPIVEVDIRH